ncbi:MAG: hypothetical protein K6G37_02100 [Bacilli bacterium]|nr:hypothetical protein [Bacilli bacterium]
MKNRSEIEEKYKLDTKSLFINDEAFEKELDEVSKNISEISKYNNSLLDGDNLLKCLDKDEEISRRLMRLYTYAHLNNDFDLSVNKYNEYVKRVIKLFNDYSIIT